MSRRMSESRFRELVRLARRSAAASRRASKAVDDLFLEVLGEMRTLFQARPRRASGPRR